MFQVLAKASGVFSGKREENRKKKIYGKTPFMDFPWKMDEKWKKNQHFWVFEWLTPGKVIAYFQSLSKILMC
jgi:hypothetical protein